MTSLFREVKVFTSTWRIFCAQKNGNHLIPVSYCGRWDLNPHDRNDHKILSLARLPVPTLPHAPFGGNSDILTL